MKYNPELGNEIKNLFKELCIENPIKDISKYNDSDKINIIAGQFENILKTLGMDMSDDSISDTPFRVAKMYVNEIFEGLDYENFPKSTTTKNSYNYNEPLTVKGIDISSTCEHHFQAIEGKASITYTPKDRVLGLSKFNRIARFFSKRPQVQERLTIQIAECLKYILDVDITVKITASHNCVKCRGIEDKNSKTKTKYNTIKYD